MSRTRALSVRLAVLFVCAGTLALRNERVDGQELAASLVADGFSAPTWVGAPPGDQERLFVMQRQGLVRIIRDGQILPTPFLDLEPIVRARVDGGLLGMAFHPDFEDNDYFYVYYTNLDGDAVVVRYEVSAGDPDVADPNSAFEIIKVLRIPGDDLHAGGFIGFHPLDGYMYISCGDGGPQGDPNSHAQDPQRMLGKILRIDVDGGSPYVIPPDNPFVNDPNTLDEIWAIGFRNPWRMCIDQETGDLYIGDVGYSSWEEVDFVPNGVGGINYGWPIREGAHCFRPRQNCDPNGELTDPILEYAHRFLPPFRCSVSGGEVYRGSSMPLLQGTYFFSDYCSNEIMAIRYDGVRIVEARDWTDEMSPPGGGLLPRIVSYGRDANDELLIVDHSGKIYLIHARMQIDATDLVAGAPASIGVVGATANARVFIAYSVFGIGDTSVPPLGVRLALANPQLGVSGRANANGQAIFQVDLPPSTVGRRVWLQAAEIGNTSDVITRVVQ
ncbi:MAG: PQQ-dependent sugar dehydrogenase [Phycisphaerales bacterium]